MNIDDKLHKIVIDSIPEKLKFNQLIPCRRCGWCCRMCNPVIITPELETICKSQNLDQNCFIKKYADKDSQDNPYGISIKCPCPFLDNENNCKIYHIRPLSCALFPFSATLLIVKPCQKGREMYEILEKWYENHEHDTVKINDKSIGNIMKDFYSRQFPSIGFIDDSDVPMELSDILKNDEIKAHGLTVVPDKKDLKKICKYLKKRQNI